MTGRIWLAGVPEPLVLDLQGDCYPDLAGCALTFENPTPVPMATKPPFYDQRGTVGDVTAARKVRVFDVPLTEALEILKAGGAAPEHMANSLYLEWFSGRSGRVVIESADYRLKISEPEWRFTAGEIAERQRHAAEDSTPFDQALDADEGGELWDEFRCEQFLRESDALSERYRVALEKYADHPDAERLVAREMGWDWIEEGLDAQENAAASEEERASPDSNDGVLEIPEDFTEPEPDPAREGIDWVRDAEERLVHPIQKRGKDSFYALFDDLRAGGHFPDTDNETLGSFVGDYMKLNGKLAGALCGLVRSSPYIDPGMVIARLKRVLEIVHSALAGVDALAGKPFLTGARLAHYRGELFGIREDILALIARLRETLE